MGGLRLEGNGAEKVYVVRRRMNDGWIWYFANTDEKCAFNGEVGFDAEAGYDSESVILMNPETGEISYANTDKLSIRLEPSDTVLIYVSHEKVSEKSNIQTPRRNIIRTSIELPQENWEFSINDLNSLPLPVWKLDIRNNGGQSVYHYSTSVVSNVYIRDVYLMLDDIEYRNAFMGLMDLTVLVNGRKIPKSEKWYIDKGFHLFPIEKIPAGQSLIEVIIRHSSWSGEPHLLTSPGALLGKFGVVSDQSGWLIVEMPSRLRFDGWNIQGYPFYSGTAEYALETEMPDMSDSAIIRVSEVSTCAELIVDGVSMGTRLWAPWEWKLPNTVSGKKVKITLRVTNTLANFLGNNLHAGPSTGAYIDVY